MVNNQLMMQNFKTFSFKEMKLTDYFINCTKKKKNQLLRLIQFQNPSKLRKKLLAQMMIMIH